MVLYRRDRSLDVDGTDLSSNLVDLGVEVSVSTQDATVTGSGNKAYGAGLPDYKVTAVLQMDRGASENYITLQGLIETAQTTGVTVIAKPASGGVHTITGPMIVTTMPLIEPGDIDGIEMLTVEFVPSGDVTVTNV